MEVFVRVEEAQTPLIRISGVEQIKDGEKISGSVGMPGSVGLPAAVRRRVFQIMEAETRAITVTLFSNEHQAR